MEKLNTVFDAFWSLHMLLYFIPVVIIPAVITCLLFFWFVSRKEIRLFKNLKRKVYLLKTGTETLETEREMLSQNGLFVVSDSVLDLSTDTRILQTLEQFSVFVIGYLKDYGEYQTIVDHAKSRNIPLIVLARTNIEKGHMDIFQQYIYFDMCNSSARLLMTILNFALITPPTLK